MLFHVKMHPNDMGTFQYFIANYLFFMEDIILNRLYPSKMGDSMQTSWEVFRKPLWKQTSVMHRMYPKISNGTIIQGVDIILLNTNHSQRSKESLIIQDIKSHTTQYVCGWCLCCEYNWRRIEDLLLWYPINTNNGRTQYTGIN